MGNLRNRQIAKSDYPKPPGEYVGYDAAEAMAKAEEARAQGKLAWLEDDYSLNMSGRREWMGFRLHTVDASIDRPSGADVIDEMIQEATKGVTSIEQLAHDHGIRGGWSEWGLELGVGIRLAILKEARDRIRSAEIKALEKKQRERMADE